MTVRVGALHSGITVLGPGRRIGLWVAGCSIGCPGCASTQWWPPDSGAAWATDALTEAILDLAPGHDGLTVSGGEPFEQAAALAPVIERVRKASQLDVLLYSGLALERIVRGPASWARLLAAADVLIDGPFVGTAPTDRPWVGSSNQRVHLRSARGRRLADSFDDPAHGRAVQVVTDGTCVRVVGIPRAHVRDEVRLAMACGHPFPCQTRGTPRHE
jgi:anaerobic ribonucleoside-triphosphate reductase activating protein